MDERRALFAHERMPVYREALLLHQEVGGLTAPLGWRYRWVADQLRRAAGSVALNIAEGTAEVSIPEKNRFYRMALRSAAEVASALDLLALDLPALQPRCTALKHRPAEVVRMLTAMILSQQRRR